MNKARRKRLEKALGMIADARSIIEEVKDDEQDAFYNMPDNIRESERGDQMDENICTLDEIVCDLEEIESKIEEIIER